MRFPRQYPHKRGKRIAENPSLSETAVDSLHQGIEDGTLLPLRFMPPMSKDADTFKSIADLEVELEYVWRSYSFTEHLLASDSIYDENSSEIHSSSDRLLSSMDILYSEPDTDERYRAESTNTSISDQPNGPVSLSQELRRDRGDPQQMWRLGNWMNQSTADQPWNSRTVQQDKSFFPLTRCLEPTPKQRLALAETRKATEKASRAYWTWDEETKKYKHYDDGCSEPVWYNPP